MFGFECTLRVMIDFYETGDTWEIVVHSGVRSQGQRWVEVDVFTALSWQHSALTQSSLHVFMLTLCTAGSAGFRLPPHQVQDHPHGHQTREHPADCQRALHQENGCRSYAVAEDRHCASPLAFSSRCGPNSRKCSMWTAFPTLNFHCLVGKIHLELIRAEEFSENGTGNALSDSLSHTLNGNLNKKHPHRCSLSLGLKVKRGIYV